MSEEIKKNAFQVYYEKNKQRILDRMKKKREQKRFHKFQCPCGCEQIMFVQPATGKIKKLLYKKDDQYIEIECVQIT